MAILDLKRFRASIPEVFDDRELPTGLDDYEVVPVDDAEHPESDPVDGEDLLDASEDRLGRTRESRLIDGPDVYGLDWIGGAGFDPSHPGGVVQRWRGTPIPPADALAFYLPFHFYHPTWWGIYLIREGVEWLRDFVVHHSGGAVPRATAFRVARMFLYGHEQFHHISECFSTRLEVTHRSPLYRVPVWQHYKATWGTSACTEEALANAWGYDKARQYGKRLSSGEWSASSTALVDFIKSSPPGYSEGFRYLKKVRFESQRRAMAEEYHHAALPTIARRHPEIWLASPHAFHGIARITSRVNYLVRKKSPLAWRAAVGSLPLRYREVSRALRGLGCVYEAPGKGSHERWRTQNGRLISVPRHTNDMKAGTLRSIFKEAGRNLSFSELKSFVNAAAALTSES